MVRELFSEQGNIQISFLKDAEIIFYPEFLSAGKAVDFFEQFDKKLPWKAETIQLFGKTHKQPRLTALFAVHGKPYTYSGIQLFPEKFPPELLEIKQRVEEATGYRFTTCLTNYYRNGKDSIGWHADDEKELGKNPVIASVSLGGARMFHLRHKKEKELRYKINLLPGSLLLMKGQTQHCWQHQIPKTTRKTGPRINLTFRRM